MKIFAFTKLLVLAILTAIAIAACHGAADNLAHNNNTPLASSPAPSADCRTIPHEMGKTQICGQPQKIAVLGPELLELLLALDVQPAGVADYFAFRQAYYNNPGEQIPYLGSRITTQPANVGWSFTPSIEALLKLKPDLIVGSEFNKAQYKTLSHVAPTLLLKWFDIQTSLRAVGQAIRQPEKAEKLIAQRQQQIATARKEFAPVVAAHPKILLLDAAQIPAIGFISKPDSCGSIIEDLRFQPVYPPGWDATKPNSRSTVVSLETLPQLDNADSVILFGQNTSEFDQLKDMDNFGQHQLSRLKQTWEKNAIAQSLKASIARRVYFIPIYLCRGLPGPIGTELYLNELRKQLLASN